MATHKVNGPSLLDQMWTILDTVTDEVMAGTLTGDDAVQRRGYARGVAECIRILSTPVFHSTDAVVQCAVARRGTDAAFSGSPSVIHHAPPDGVISSEELAEQAATEPEVPGTDAAPIPVPAPDPGLGADGPGSVDELTAAQRDSIAAALRAGLPPEAVAAAFSVAEHVVAQVVWQ